MSTVILLIYITIPGSNLPLLQRMEFYPDMVQCQAALPRKQADARALGHTIKYSGCAELKPVASPNPRPGR